MDGGRSITDNLCFQGIFLTVFLPILFYFAVYLSYGRYLSKMCELMLEGLPSQFLKSSYDIES